MAPRTIDLKKAQRTKIDPNTLWLRRLRGRLYALRSALKTGGLKADVDRLRLAMAPAVKAHNWPEALVTAEDWAARAQASGDRPLLKRLGNDMRRLGRYGRGFELIAQSHRSDGPKEWSGENLAGKTLLIERREGDLASFLSFLPVVGLAAGLAQTCIVLVDARLRDLYERTFPGLDVRTEQLDANAALEDADVVASFEMLAFHLRWDVRQSVRLRPDPRLVAEFREAYRSDRGRPIIGIAWGSLNPNKETPRLRDWTRLIAALPGSFVSLQYGDVDSVIAAFEKAVPGRVFYDRTVDQLVDMDRFAAQVASVDAVVTISNTVAHTAGALGVPTVILLDGAFEMIWPAEGHTVPWYEAARLIRKGDHDWNSAIDAAARQLSSICSGDS